MTILVFGSINMDLTAYAPRLPQQGETLLGHSFVMAPGGKGANQAVAAARLGAATRLVGRVGDDSFGREVLAVIGADGVDTSRVMVDPNSDTALAVISVGDDGQNAIVVISGANMALDETDVARCRPALEDARFLLLQLEVPLAASLAVARTAQERGLTVILDPAPAVELPPELYALTDVITPNEVEAAMLLGYEVGLDTAAQAARELRERGAQSVVLKLGDRGAYYLSAAGEGLTPAFDIHAIDTVAAGDAFNAGLVVALAEGHPLSEAVRWGTAAGAVAVTRAGAAPSMPKRSELEEMLAGADA